MLGDVSEFAKALEPLIRKIVDERTKNALRVERYEVSTAANGTVMGVRQPYGTEIFLPYSNSVEGAHEGDSVLVLWRGALSNAKVWSYADGPADVTLPKGTVDSTSTSTQFTATVGGITELRDGVQCYLTNGVVTSAAGWTLNVNGLGAKPVYQSMAAAGVTTTIFNINYSMLFIYNEHRIEGGCWDIFYGYNTNDNTIAYNVRDYQSNKLMASALYRYMVCFTGRNGKLIPSCNTSNSTSTSKTLSTAAFDPFLPIYFYASTTTVSANASPGGSSLWLKYSTANLRYAFNVGTSSLAEKQPVYLRCAPQTDGTVKLDGNNCVVQALPDSADGKVYLLLGYSYSGYQVEFGMQHPIFQYVNGKIQPWSGV